MPTYVKISDIPISRAALATDKMEVQATGAGASAQVTAQSVADLYVPSTTLTGDVGGSGSGNILTTLATVNSNVGSFTAASITVNAKGLITAASSGGSGSAVAMAMIFGS